MNELDEPLTVGIGPLDQIPLGEGRSFRIGLIEIAVFRTRHGEVFAVQANCPHRGGPLSDGIVGDRRVVCPLHGYAFDLASGDPIRNACAALRTFPVSVSPQGELRVTLHPRERAGVLSPSVPD
jgi:nitrite reductase (NADH) small subunit